MYTYKSAFLYIETFLYHNNTLSTGDTKVNNDLASVSTNILNSFPQLNEMVAASATGATAESLLQSVVNLVGAAQAVAAVTSTAESTATSTAEDSAKGTSCLLCVSVCNTGL